MTTNTIEVPTSSQRGHYRTSTEINPMDNPRDASDRDGGFDAPLDGPLNAAVHRRVTVAVCWALARRAALDGRELFEDSYAINEEFREWLLTLEDHPELLQANVLMVPRDLHLGRRPETDGLLEI
ncbi:hypothetical protein [Synechococcus sp. CCY 0621]|uniref:hypothetical protein n=1 Tax=Synechococcus sp. CCY 0621 TaxID=2815603 RepID=UPI00256FCC3F|nr:hypothetical protein [Synechococcus sp. CCY 0621]